MCNFWLLLLQFYTVYYIDNFLFCLMDCINVIFTNVFDILRTYKFVWMSWDLSRHFSYLSHFEGKLGETGV